jgi:hypothetical protein
MSFLGWPMEQSPVTATRSYWRKKVATDLLALFDKAFREITYDLIWESPTINAQAWLVGTIRRVSVYGGLVRHPVMTRSGIALMIAHETGHHLGGQPRDPAMPWITWQGKADYWAARDGMPIVFGSHARSLTLRGARQILTLHQALAPLFEGDEPDLSAECRYRIFCAGALGSEIPACAEAEFRECYQKGYSQP